MGYQARLQQALNSRFALAKQDCLAARRRLETEGLRLRRAALAMVGERRARLLQLEQLRRSLGPTAALSRGFALVRDAAGGIIRSAAAVSAGQKLELEFADGKISAQAESGSDPKPRRARKSCNESQGSLF